MGITLKRVEGLTHFEMIENKPQAHVATLVGKFSCQGPDEITIDYNCLIKTRQNCTIEPVQLHSITALLFH